MSLIDKLEKSAQSIEQFNEGVLIGLETTADKLEAHNGRIADFFKDVYRDPVATFKQLYKDVLTYTKK
jgi:hypothetical protein